jgi:hypothetical protein
VEIASDELITDAEKERFHKVVNELCAEVCAAFCETEARLTARATFHDAVVAAAKTVAEGIGDEAVPIVKEIVQSMLKDPSQHPYVEGLVVEEARPVARNGAYSAIRRWSEARAIPQAEQAAAKIISEHLDNSSMPFLHTAAMAGIRVVLENQVAINPEVSAAAREQAVQEYLNCDARKSAAEIVARSLTAQLRRQAQRASEIAVEKIAAEATDNLARAEALDAARVVAIDTAKLEISRLVLAEVQRRAARQARERLQVEAPAQEDEKRAEYCQEEAGKIAEEALKSVTEEIADPSVTELDLSRARELALAAALAVAREFSNPYQMVPDADGTQVSTKTLVLLGLQIFTGCFIIWFFLLGGYETCQPILKVILPAPVYESIYRAVPHQERPDPATRNTVEVDDLLDEQKPAGNARENSEPELPAIPPAGLSPEHPTPGHSASAQPPASTGPASTAPASTAPASTAPATTPAPTAPVSTAPAATPPKAPAATPPTAPAATQKAPPSSMPPTGTSSGH